MLSESSSSPLYSVWYRLAHYLESNSCLDKQLDEDTKIKAIDQATASTDDLCANANLDLDFDENAEGYDDVQQIANKSEQDSKEQIDGEEKSADQTSNIKENLQLNKDGHEKLDEDRNADVDGWVRAIGGVGRDHGNQELNLSNDLNGPSFNTAAAVWLFVSIFFVDDNDGVNADLNIYNEIGCTAAVALGEGSDRLTLNQITLFNKPKVSVSHRSGSRQGRYEGAKTENCVDDAAELHFEMVFEVRV